MHNYHPRMFAFVRNGSFRTLKALAALALVLVLSSCYLPVRYDAEIDLSRTGYYDFYFDGYLAKVQLYQDLKDNKIDRDEEAEQVQLIKDDFARDPAASEFKYYEKGHFHINYKRSGDLLKTKTMTFYRRNEYMLGLAYNKNTGQITMLGKSLKRDIKDRLRAAGLDSSGEASGVHRRPRRQPQRDDGQAVQFKGSELQTLYMEASQSAGADAGAQTADSRAAVIDQKNGPSVRRGRPFGKIKPILGAREAADQARRIPALAAHGDDFAVELIDQRRHRQLRAVDFGFF